ncbi:hypothetical protein KAM351_27130 [Aeromonas caviae]|uniref:Replication protein RepA n=2 Tax=Aeromonas caviae TaxID=648 RepID=A0AA37FVS1_AERCA|nr:hypothetical protein KAM351_27130 [Aeromonas caviae]
MTFSPALDGLNVGSGNRCGHNPSNPSFLVKPHAHKIPKILSRSRELVELYYSRLKELPQLDTLNPHRKKRSERREAVIQTLKALLKYMDLVTMTVGIPTKDGQVGLTLVRLHKEVSISWPRFKRALADLRAAGFLSISQPRMTNSAGQVRGLVGIKAISPRLFEALKIDFWLRRERDRASKRQRTKANQAGVTQRSLYQRSRPPRQPAPQGPESAARNVGQPSAWAQFKASAAARQPLS